MMQQPERHETATTGRSVWRRATLQLESSRSEQEPMSYHVFCCYLGHLCSCEPLLAGGEEAKGGSRPDT